MSANKEIKIDFVIPWVDGSDPVWIQEKKKFKPGSGTDSEIKRYRDWGTLKYWFRAIEKFAPWVNRVYFIHADQIPDWMNLSYSKLVTISHRDYIPEQYLPTFNANPIELNMHRIKDLSEHFVYFNDDMYLLRPVTPGFFFKRGLPCDDMIFSPIIMEGNNSSGKMVANDMEIINTHFEKGTLVRNCKHKLLHLSYGKQLLRTLCLMPWHHITGFYNDHLPQPFLKRTFEDVWTVEPELLQKVSSHRFRDYANDVNQWLMRYWQFCKGDFFPTSPRRGKCFTDVNNEALSVIRRQSKSLICINDNNEMDFERHQKMLLDAFKSILPEKSIFEK